MEAAPAAALEMSEPDLLLEFLIVALDAPAQLGKVHQAMEGDAFGKGREPVFGRFLLAFGPLDQQPFFRSALAALEITPRNANAHPSKARRQRLGGAFAPFGGAPGRLGQGKPGFLDPGWVLLGVAPPELWGPAPTRPLLWWHRRCGRGAHRRVRQT